MACMLIGLVENEIRILVNEFLHGVLHELIKGVKLLPYETLLLEETGDDRPAVFLRNLLELLFFLILHAVIWVIVSSNKRFQDLISAKEARNRYLDSWSTIPSEEKTRESKRLTRGFATEVPGVEVYFGNKLDLSKTKK